MAANLVAILFEGEHTADGMLATLNDMQARGAIKLEDAALATRAAQGERIVLSHGTLGSGNADSPGTLSTGQRTVPEAEVKQTRDRRRRAALAGGGLGLLIGTVLGGPVGGLLVGGLIGGLRDRGIDNGFIQEVAQQLKPDSSAIFLLVGGGDADQVMAELKPFKGRVLHTTLPDALDKQLRDALRDEE